jgi:RNA polymerase sigma-70 factor (ECF subfamily)
MTRDQPDDGALLLAVAAGDEDAFVQLYRRRSRGVYRFAYQMSGSATVAEEVVQDVFLALMREAGRFEPARGSFLSYLYGIARNHVLRQQRRRPLVALDARPDLVERLSAPDDPLAEAERRETVATVRRAVQSLPPHYREAILLCDIEGLDYRDAALALECPIGTVRSRLARARALLAEKLRERLTRERHAVGVRCAT